MEEDCAGVGEWPRSQDSRAEILECTLYCAWDEGNSLSFRLIQQLQIFNVGILRECERPQKGVAARPSFGRIHGCQSSEGVTRVRPFICRVFRWRKSPAVARLTMEAALVARTTMVAGPVTAMVVRLIMEAS